MAQIGNDFIIRRGNCLPRPSQRIPFAQRRNNRHSDLDGYYLQRHLQQADARFQNREIEGSSSEEASVVGSDCTQSDDRSSYLENDLMASNAIKGQHQKKSACYKDSSCLNRNDRYFKYVASYVIVSGQCRITQETTEIQEAGELKQITGEDTVCVLSPPPNPLLKEERESPKTADFKTIRNQNYRSVGGLVWLPPQETALKTVTEENRLLVALDRRYTNVKVLRLVSSCVPFYDTIINSQNCQVSFQFQDEHDVYLTPSGTDTFQFTLPHANLSVEEIAQQMVKKMNGLVKEKVCDCEHSLLTDKGNHDSPVTGDQTNRNLTDPFFYELDLVSGSLEFKTHEPYTFTITLGSGIGSSKRDLATMLGFRDPNQETFTDCWSNDPLQGFRLCLDEQLLVQANTRDDLNKIYDCQTNSHYFTTVKLEPGRHFEPRSSSFGFAPPTIYDGHLSLDVVVDNGDLEFNYLDFSFFNESGQPINVEKSLANLQFVIEIVEASDRLVGQNLNTRRGVADSTTMIDQRVETFLGTECP